MPKATLSLALAVVAATGACNPTDSTPEIEPAASEAAGAGAQAGAAAVPTPAAEGPLAAQAAG